MSSSADDTALTTLSMLTPEDERGPQDINSIAVVPLAGTSYDHLDFNRPIRHLKPHYTSSSTLKSVKSTNGNNTRDGGDGSSDDAESPHESVNGNTLPNRPTRRSKVDNPVRNSTTANALVCKPEACYEDDGYIDCADLVRRHIDNSHSPSSFVIRPSEGNTKLSLGHLSQNIVPEVGR